MWSLYWIGCIHSLDWTAGLEHWTGLLNWHIFGFYPCCGWFYWLRAFRIWYTHIGYVCHHNVVLPFRTFPVEIVTCRVFHELRWKNLGRIVVSQVLIQGWRMVFTPSRFQIGQVYATVSPVPLIPIKPNITIWTCHVWGGNISTKFTVYNQNIM